MQSHVDLLSPSTHLYLAHISTTNTRNTYAKHKQYTSNTYIYYIYLLAHTYIYYGHVLCAISSLVVTKYVFCVCKCV